MNLDQFVQQRQSSWRDLEGLLQRARNNLSHLSEQEIGMLGRYYRMATSDLALAQRDFPNQKVVIYLNQLVGRSHALIYQSDPLSWRRLALFYRYTFPQLYRDLSSYTTLSFLLFLLPAVAAFFTVWFYPDVIYVIMPGPGTRDLVEEVEQGKLWTEIEPSIRSVASVSILTNNIQVMFLTFAGGITAGLFSAWIMISNGMNIGGIFGLLQANNLSPGLAEFVLAHGFVELSVILLAGGCGLYLGDAILRPGLLTRRAALIQRAHLCVRLILACTPLLIIAGLIEGFISPSGLPWLVKLAVGLATGIALHAYWLLAGRTPVEP